LYVASRSKIDTWSNIPIERNEHRFINQPMHIKTEAKSRVDTWLTTDYQTRQRSVEVHYLFNFILLNL
jgi:hypothetical protein